MKNMFFTLCLVIFLAGCDTDDDKECGDGNLCAPPSDIPPDPSILGLWDSGSVQNTSFTYIGAADELLIYDYQQDDFGNGENCYVLFEGMIRRQFQESNNYSFTRDPADPETVINNAATVFLQDGELKFNFSGDERTWQPVTSLTMDDLVLCE